MNLNPYLIIVLSAVAGEFILNNLSRYLTMKSLNPELPDEFSGVYDQYRYKTSQDYTRENIRFSGIQSVFSVSVTIIFILLGGFNYIDKAARGMSDAPIISGLLFFGLLFFLQDLLSMPFAVYQTFGIEKKYGFNKTTPMLFIKDKLRAYILTCILGTVILGLILYVFDLLGKNAWIAAWIIIIVLTLIMPTLYTNIIAPLFNKFLPLEEGELKEKLLRFAAEVNFPLKGIFVMDGSKRSTHSNAYFTGFGKNKRIVLFDTLMKTHSVAELVGIIAHEIGHYKKKHIIKGMIFSIIHSGLLLFIMSFFINNEPLFAAFKMDTFSVYASLVFFGLVFSPIEILLSIILNFYSRRHEFEADHFAVMSTADPSAFIMGLKNLSSANLSNLTPHPFTVIISYSHPPVLERIRNIRQNSNFSGTP